MENSVMFICISFTMVCFTEIVEKVFCWQIVQTTVVQGSAPRVMVLVQAVMMDFMALTVIFVGFKTLCFGINV